MIGLTLTGPATGEADPAVLVGLGSGSGAGLVGSIALLFARILNSLELNAHCTTESAMCCPFQESDSAAPEACSAGACGLGEHLKFKKSKPAS